MCKVESIDEKIREANIFLEESGSYDKFRALTISVDEATQVLHQDPAMAHKLIYVKKMPQPVLDYLARKFDDKIKMQVAGKYPLLDATYEYLAAQSDEIRVRIYFNKKVPDFVKEKIAGEASSFVKSEIERWEEWLRSRKR